MDLLKRELAPLVPAAFEAIEEEATRTLRLNLAGRKLVDFDGPHGWDTAAINTGELDLLDQEPVEGVGIGVRRAQPLIELRTPVRLAIMELDALGRGAASPDLSAVAGAAERVARVEDGAIFNGLGAAGISGILEASPHPAVRVESLSGFARAVLSAMAVLQRASINGPYAVALGPKLYDEVFAAVEGCYPVAAQISRQVIEGPIVRAPAIDAGLVLSVRGGDYRLVVGVDLSIGYADRDREHVELFLTESFTFCVQEPAAAVRLDWR